MPKTEGHLFAAIYHVGGLLGVPYHSARLTFGKEKGEHHLLLPVADDFTWWVVGGQIFN